jgi:DNA gyrase/topoisomerase IV subunit B
MPSKMNDKEIANKYKKKTQLEHILDLPDTYIGGVQSNEEECFIYNDTTEKINKKKILFNPGLYKIFDEIVANAFDETVRSGTGTDTIKVEIDKEKGEINVFNNGKGIPVIYKEEEKMYIPEMIFGQLLTSANYGKNDKKYTLGKNGLGSKLTNIFSSEFTLETVDSDRKTKLKVTWKDNMGKKSKAKLTECNKEGYAKITFKPDLKRFGMTKLTDDMISYMKKRVYDIAFCTSKNVSVYYNKKKIPIKKMEDYMKLYLSKDDKRKIIVDDTDEKWQVGLFMNEDNFEQVSFVNAGLTSQGGTHITSVSKSIIDEYTRILKKKKLNVKPNYIKEKMFLFVKSLIINPAFSSQSKTQLTTRQSDFSSKWDISKNKKFIGGLSKLGIIEEVESFAKYKEAKDMKKTDGKVVNKVRVKKLDDAIHAGTKKSKDCMLILVEGLSAKTFAVSGLSKIGREKYGIYPLKGKLINVKAQANQKVMKNEEINDIKTALGLKTGHKYKSLDELRYGGVVVLTDSDSVTGDTPLLLKDKYNNIIIKNIEDLTERFLRHESDISGKEYGHNNEYQIWTDNGWTNIKHIMRHKVSKKMYRVLTHTGCVDVTEDHSLLNTDKQKITPNECKVGQKLLHSFPSFEENSIEIPDNLEKYSIRELWKYASCINIQHYQRYKKSELIIELEEYKNLNKYKLNTNNELNITKEEAWVMGFFMADGSCGIYKFSHTYKSKNRPRAYTTSRTGLSWHLDNCNLKLLEKSKKILENIYPELNGFLKILETDKKNKNIKSVNQCYRLILNGGQQTKFLIEKYRELLYYKKYKYMNYKLLNTPKNIRQSFYDGYYEGDGRHTDEKHTHIIDINSKITTQSLFLLTKSLGYNVSLNHNKRKECVYSMIITKGKQQDDPNRIKKIIELPHKEQYVYDLETENHHFQAGPGQMIVHNTDGHHIKGLVMNFFETYWPELLELGIVKTLMTPVVKAFHKRNKKDIIKFYNVPDYEKWKKTKASSNYNVKYFKGLGTSTTKEAKECFEDFLDKINTYNTDNETKQNIALAFDKTKANDRKKWLANYDRNLVVDNKQKNINVSDFINKELIHFSIDDIKRSIPNIMDGLKPTQRKVLYTSLKYLTKSEIKVAQFAAKVSEKTAYHHGEASVVGTIINMAQNYVGSNNCNLLLPKGQFGSRLAGGNDHASERYIFTNISKITELLFKEIDNNILKYLDDDGMLIEPEWYVPVIPTILVNGSVGIGTGFSTNIPCHKVEDIVDNIKRKLNNEQVKKMLPYYRNFNGQIKEIEPKRFVSYGEYIIDEKKNTITITELPIGTWTDTYRTNVLEKMLDDKKTLLKSYLNYSTESKVNFVLKFTSTDMKKLIKKKPEDIYKLFRLTSNINETNMYLFDKDNKIKKYNDTTEILEEFCTTRLQYYQHRKDYLIKKLNDEITELKNKVRFIREVKNKTINILDIGEKELEDLLSKRKYDKINNNYDYLTTMSIRILTNERANKMEKLYNDKLKELEIIKNTTIKSMWLDDLDKVLEENKAYNCVLSNEINNEKIVKTKCKKSRK